MQLQVGEFVGGQWWRIITACRMCKGELEPLFDFGEHYVSDFPLEPVAVEAPVPLVLVRCRECELVQLRDEVPRDRLYRKSYWYRSSVQPEMVHALWDVVCFAEKFTRLERGDWALDVGANDGTLLRLLAERHPGLNKVAFDPAENLHSQLMEHCDILVPSYFPAEQYDAPRARLITSIAMFYDLPDPRGFVREVKRLLHPEGVWVLQLGDLRALMCDMAFDAVCHEHLEYYSMRTLRKLIEGEGLVVVAAERNFVNGGSLRLAVKHVGHAVDGSVDMLCSMDKELEQPEMWDYWVKTLREIYKKVRWRVEQARERGPVDLLGASTKGNTLLQYLQLGNPGTPFYEQVLRGAVRSWIPVRRAVERSPAKVGRYTVGSWVPIVGEEEGRRDPARTLLVLPWHFRGALLERERKMGWPEGTKLLFPLPTVEEVEL